mmetsp:Transcript_36384/g.71063  ORF Transcript_36384/g.71063 Transcript_36384/m.71063 type:complete len:342 (+) Transcript_36384:348-1373(+)|eukprot:CAMPEP_0173393144 /NCGR_PEP_ID=MMETSP1356-20130122/21940_1 /TAXON_ID=77927 ORGANISM="Hemiselmis virescens, Strain PCC157" /NCGR_SAMPLE_ID=MMETSP1356 /ASSEMBLY_ACC=CAM_ASM_000847 /LENGTH=341 /DNA_ID=CAMNT_0014351123 /DNA_START=344 /DNA_END=1369 /DNA_ORIENTATION=-
MSLSDNEPERQPGLKKSTSETSLRLSRLLRRRALDAVDIESSFEDPDSSLLSINRTSLASREPTKGGPQEEEVEVADTVEGEDRDLFEDCDDTIPCITRDRSYSLPDVRLSGDRVCAHREGDMADRMRQVLKLRGFNEVDDVLDDDYIQNVTTRIKNGKQRTFEYSAEKLQASLRWRREYGAAKVVYQDVEQSLAPQHMVWQGLDLTGRPILYVKPSLMDLSTYDRENYLKAHVYLLEQGMGMMPKGTTTFMLVADASGLGRQHTDIKLMRQLVHIATLAYPDRLGTLMVGPVNMVVRGVWSIVSRLISKNMASKICFVQSPSQAIREFLPEGQEPPEWLA